MPPEQVLPDSLGDALSKASAATCTAIARGGVSRCLVRFCDLHHALHTRRTLGARLRLVARLAAQVELLLPAFWDPTSGAVFSGAPAWRLFCKGDLQMFQPCQLSVLGRLRGGRPAAFLEDHAPLCGGAGTGVPW